MIDGITPETKRLGLDRLLPQEKKGVPGAWTEFAKCKGKADLFFPYRGETDTAQRAKAICHTCPVKEPCLEYALGTNEQYGVWGETTVDERRSIKRRRQRDTRKAS